MASRVSLAGYRGERTEVIRRFRDFVWLQHRLRAEFRGAQWPGARSTAVLAPVQEQDGAREPCSSAAHASSPWVIPPLPHPTPPHPTPGIIVPALPEKNVVEKYKMTAGAAAREGRAPRPCEPGDPAVPAVQRRRRWRALALHAAPSTCSPPPPTPTPHTQSLSRRGARLWLCSCGAWRRTRRCAARLTCACSWRPARRSLA